MAMSKNIAAFDVGFSRSDLITLTCQYRLKALKKGVGYIPNPLFLLVGAAGFEPATPAV